MAIIGYASATSVPPVGLLSLHLSASPPGAATLSFERVGGPRMPEVFTNVAVAQRPEPPEAWLGFGWPATHTFRVPSGWPTGLYRVYARMPGDAADTWVTEFVVRPVWPGASSRIVVAVDFLTVHAYNEAGGRTFYEGNGVPRATMLSLDRPLMGSHLHYLRTQADLIPWLAARGFAAEVVSTLDLHTQPALLDAYDCLVFGGHVEYWSAEMRDQVERFVRNGGNVVSLSGNTCFRQIRVEGGGRMLVCYKNPARDPFPDLSRTTTAFAHPPVHRPPNSMLGVGWTHGAWGGHAAVGQEYKPYFPTHWVYEGTPPRTNIPVLHTYETDAAPFVVEPEGYPRVLLEEGTPASTVVLASADLLDWRGKPGMATMTLYTRHGQVFSAGTTHWLELLEQPDIARITARVMTRLRERRRFDWEAVGHARAVTAMAALDGRLWATQVDTLWFRYPVLADCPWRRAGHANTVAHLAGGNATLFAITTDNRLWWRPGSDADVPWESIGDGITGGTRALAFSGSMLYAVGPDGRLWSRPARRTGVGGWALFGTRPTHPAIVAMTSYNGVLLAVTSQGELLRNSHEVVEESPAWVRLHSAPAARGLAVVEGMLFLAGADDRLYWLDLFHRQLDLNSTQP